MLGCSHRRAQSGIVLIVAMMALIVMGFAGLALVRATDATTAVVGSVGGRTASLYAADLAVEQAIGTLFEERRAGDFSADVPAQNYFASRQAAEDSRGVPAALLRISGYPADFAVVDAGNGQQLRYVIERLCTHAGAALPAQCVMALEHPNVVGESPHAVIFRVTSRIDGPGGASLHTQAFVADLPARRRLAWRAIGD